VAALDTRRVAAPHPDRAGRDRTHRRRPRSFERDRCRRWGRLSGAPRWTVLPDTAAARVRDRTRGAGPHCPLARGGTLLCLAG
jgi:hypothetical protein